MPSENHYRRMQQLVRHSAAATPAVCGIKPASFPPLKVGTNALHGGVCVHACGQPFIQYEVLTLYLACAAKAGTAAFFTSSTFAVTRIARMKVTKNGYRKTINGKIFDCHQVFFITNLPNDESIMEDVTGSIIVDAEIEVQAKGEEVACKVGLLEPCSPEQRKQIANSCVEHLKLLGVHAPRTFMSYARETVKYILSDAGRLVCVFTQCLQHQSVHVCVCCQCCLGTSLRACGFTCMADRSLQRR